MISFLYKLLWKEAAQDNEPPMYLIVWLWNPWKEYATTRHNAWCMVVDTLAEERCDGRWKNHRESKSLVCLGSWEWEKVLLIKPQTYMNRSWPAIRYRMNFYKIKLDSLLVIHDDIDLPPQRLKLKKWWSSGGQNWVKDTIEKLWTKDFWRLKCGIWRPLNPKFQIHDYVLWTMKGDELAFWEDEWKRFLEKVEEWRRNR